VQLTREEETARAERIQADARARSWQQWIAGFWETHGRLPRLGPVARGARARAMAKDPKRSNGTAARAGRRREHKRERLARAAGRKRT